MVGWLPRGVWLKSSLIKRSFLSLSFSSQRSKFGCKRKKKEIAMEDVNQLFDAAFEFAHYPGNYNPRFISFHVLRDCSLIPITVSISGPQGDSSVKEFLDRFPLPVIFKWFSSFTSNSFWFVCFWTVWIWSFGFGVYGLVSLFNLLIIGDEHVLYRNTLYVQCFANGNGYPRIWNHAGNLLGKSFQN